MITCVNDGFEQTQHAGQLVRRDVAGVFQLHGARQQIQAGVVLGERALEQREVEAVDVLGDVGKRVFGNCVEEDVGVAEAQVEVQQDDRVFRVRGERAAEVHGEARRADAARGAGDGDDRAGWARVARAAGALPGDTLERGGQVFGLERLREELFRTGSHRSEDQVAVGRRAGN